MLRFLDTLFRHGALRLRDNEFGQGTGPIWLSELQCRGDEPSVGHCQHLGWGTASCSHYQDVAITCYAGNDLS